MARDLWVVDHIVVKLSPERVGFWATTTIHPLVQESPLPAIAPARPARRPENLPIPEVGRPRRLTTLAGGLLRTRRYLFRHYQPVNGIVVVWQDKLELIGRQHPLLGLSDHEFAKLAPCLASETLCDDGVVAARTAGWLREQGADPEVYLALRPDFIGTPAELLAATRLVSVERH